MNVSSLISGSSTTSSSSSNGLSGLASGIDTESMVTAMLSGTQSKIDKQTALKQQTLWKQEIYRSIISSINTFQTKYFSTSSGTNLLSGAFYNVMNAVTQSQAFKVTATSSAAVGTTSMKVHRLATNAKVTSSDSVSGKLAGTIDATALQSMVDSELSADRTLVLTVGGQDISVDLKDVFVDGSGNFTSLSDQDKAAAIAQKINDAFAANGITDASASVKDGVLTLSTTDTSKSITISSSSSEAALKSLGLTAGKRTALSGDQLVLTSTMNLKSEFTLNVTLDDNQKTIKVDLSTLLQDGTTQVGVDKMRTALQEQLNKAHGTDQIILESVGSDGFELKVGTGRKVMVGGSSESLAALGMKNGQSNKIGLGGTLKDLYFSTPLQGSDFSFTINGQSFQFSDSATISEVMNTINSSDAGVRVVYKPLEDKFIMEATNSGAGFDITMSDQSGNLLESMFGTGVYEPGQNAKVEIDGVITERSSNNFTVNGLNIQLKSESTGDAEEIEVSRGTDQIVDGIKSFINDYNALIEELNNLLREDTTYRTYAPLTDAQKKEMSEKEIELWEEKAKSGLLHNDSSIQSFLQSMRNALFTKSAGSTLSLFDLGIDTSSDYKDYGKLVLSADGEAKLRQVIESSPDEVIKFFTDEENGLAVRLNKIINATANVNSGSAGTLVKIAGMKNKATDTDNDLYYRLKAIDDRITALKRTYEKEKSRYWNQFNAMEQLISNMNSQSSWLTAMMG